MFHHFVGSRAFKTLATAAVLSLAAATAPVDAGGFLERAFSGRLEDRRTSKLENLFPAPGRSIGLKAALETLEPAQRVAFARQFQGMLLTYFSPRLLDAQAVAGLSPFAQRVLAPTVQMAGAQQPDELLALLASLDVDHLTPLPVETWQLAHEHAMLQPVPGGTTLRGELMASDRRDPEAWAAAARQAPGFVQPDGAPPMTAVTLLAEGDAVPPSEVPTSVVEPGPYGFFVTGSFVVEAPHHVLANSGRLARALNELANDRSAAGPLTVHLPDGNDLAASAPGDLVEGLREAGYDVRIYDARLGQDFCDYYLQQGEELVAVRMATWFALPLDPARPGAEPAADAPPLLLPADHSEHLVVVWKRGTCEPVALVKWYMGLTSGPTVQGMRFRPATTRHAPWTGYRILRSYSSRRDVRRMVEAGAALQRFVNFVQLRYQLPIWGYCYSAVCNDSTALMEAVLSGSPRDVPLWGLVRDLSYEFYLQAWLPALGLRLRTLDDGRQVLGVPSDVYPNVPSAPSRKELLRRLGYTVLSRDPAQLHFPDVRSAVEQLSRNSSTFRRALEE